MTGISSCRICWISSNCFLRIDELFAKVGRETDVAVRKKQFDEIQQILHDEMPVIFLVELSYTHVWNKRVHGLITNGISMYSSWSGVWKD